MKEEKIDKNEKIKFEDIRKSIDKKLGKENSSLIADDMASLITFNAEREKTLNTKNEEIEKLRKDKETLIQANGNLLQQVNQASEEIFSPRKEEKEEKKPFNFRDMFDEKGQFKRKL